MKNVLKNTGKISLFFIFATLILFLKTHLTGDFRIGKVLMPQAGLSEEKSSIADEKIITYLNQDYHYLSWGHHSYVFLSQDGQYVIKFLRYHKFCPSLAQRIIRGNLDPDRDRAYFDPRFFFILKSFEIAKEILPDLSGSLYFHTKASSDLPKSLTLWNQTGQKFILDPNRSLFVLQKKTQLFKEIFREIKEKKDQEKLKTIISQYLLTTHKRAKRLIMNKDRRGFLKNYGYLKDENRVLEIDIGSMAFSKLLDTQEGRRHELFDCSRQLREWLIKYFPDMEFYLDEELEKVLQKE